MYNFRMILCITSILAMFALNTTFAQTIHLTQDQQWQDVSESQTSAYLLAVSKLKQSINAGDIDDAQLQICQLTAQYPDLTGPDFEAFMSAEYLFADGNWTKAADSYKDFVKDFPESWLYEAALERQFDIANAFLGGQRRNVLKFLKLTAYEDGQNMMQEIADKTTNIGLAHRSLERLADSYEKRGKYLEAYNVWAQISSRWPTSQIGKEALLGMARSMYSSYKGPKYQSTNLESAKGYYEKFITIHEQDAQELNITKVKDQIAEQLAYKQYNVAKYYHRTGSFVAASVYYKYVIDNWPQSSAAELAAHQLEVLDAQQHQTRNAKPKQRKGLKRFFDFLEIKNYLSPCD